MKEKDEEIEVLPERDVEVEVAQGIGEPIGPVVVGVEIDVKLMINVEVLVEAVISISPTESNTSFSIPKFWNSQCGLVYP